MKGKSIIKTYLCLVLIISDRFSLSQNHQMDTRTCVSHNLSLEMGRKECAIYVIGQKIAPNGIDCLELPGCGQASLIRSHHISYCSIIKEHQGKTKAK